MTVEDLVPPLELCQQIPAGEFADSAFVWTQETAAAKQWYVAHREDVEFCRKNLWNAPPVYPAPTLAEWVSRHGIKGGDKDEYLRVLMKI
jgi:hypothetical protein